MRVVGGSAWRSRHPARGRVHAPSRGRHATRDVRGRGVVCGLDTQAAARPCTLARLPLPPTATPCRLGAPAAQTPRPLPLSQTAWTHIKDMVVRGAPAIGVTGALALAVDLARNKRMGADLGSAAEAVAYIQQTLEYLVTR